MAEIIKVEGLADLQLTLQGLPTHLRDKVMYKLLRKAATPILNAAKQNAPVAKKRTKRVIPGLVKNTLKISRSRYWKPQRGEFGVYIKPISPSKVQSLKRRYRQAGHVYFGDPWYYRFQEAGFHSVGKTRIRGSFPSIKRRSGEKSQSLRARRQDEYLAGKHTKVEGLKFIGRAWEANKMKALQIINADLVAAIIEQFNKGANRGKRSING